MHFQGLRLRLEPSSLARFSSWVTISRSSSSTALWQLLQIRNGTECAALLGWWQATKAFTDSSLCTKPLAIRKSRARYTVGGASAPTPLPLRTHSSSS
ncbi:hypothetical protein VM57_05935 [Stenotrophomonas maltophilia]|uniref:Uncharacterized protein n=1 Tax=Stenotrophomonas maltophilia TaxID=40324 RepID=A0A0F5ZR52_STEMA|nr:hypothetical protein VM57_05935 [Stenotrophomonas maltophilia]